MKEITDLGFKKNTKTVNGYIPHFTKGEDVLFLIGSKYYISRIVNINNCFENYKGKVFGLITNNAPALAERDWITAPKLTLLRINPTSVGQWKKDFSDIEFVPTEI
jgi:hypothetical protein